MEKPAFSMQKQARTPTKHTLLLFGLVGILLLNPQPSFAQEEIESNDLARTVEQQDSELDEEDTSAGQPDTADGQVSDPQFEEDESDNLQNPEFGEPSVSRELPPIIWGDGRTLQADTSWIEYMRRRHQSRVVLYDQDQQDQEEEDE